MRGEIELVEMMVYVVEKDNMIGKPSGCCDLRMDTWSRSVVC